MKVKVITSSYVMGLESKINSFIEDKEIIDIKFQSYENFMLVVILYKEEE